MFFTSQPARKFESGEAANEVPTDSLANRLAAHVQGFATKTKALLREIPTATQTFP